MSRGGLSQAAVAIDPSGTSTTGVAVLELPTSHDGGVFLISSMSAINEQNWIVGTGHASSGRSDAVLWRGGATFERPLGAQVRSTLGLGLGENGMVVGQIRFTPAIGWRWQDGAGHTFLPTPPLSAFGLDWDARDVDASGNILVVYRRTNAACSTTITSAVLRSPYEAADYEILPAPECLSSLTGNEIDGGTVVGQVSTPPPTGAPNEAFLWDGGAAVDLIGGGAAMALSGDFAAGHTFAAGEALRWVLGSPPQLLGTLGGATSQAHGVNSLGWVVGQSVTATGETHAFLWTPAEGMIDLGTLGGNFSVARDVNDAGYVVGDAVRADGQRVPVVWIVGATDQPPEIETIVSQVVTVGETLVVEPVVTDPEDDPFTLSWSGDVPANGVVNGTLTWTPTPDQVGDHTITVTATQDDDPGLLDEETFVVSVLPAETPTADVRVGVAPVGPGPRLVGEAVPYLATVHNAGPDAASIDLSITLEHRDQSEWGEVPPEAAANGIFFLELGVLAAGASVDVPFEVVYGAFGIQTVTASLGGAFDELAPADNVGAFEQVVDLPLDAPGVQGGGLDVPGGFTGDGLGLAVAGVRIPGALVAGGPPWDLFLPADLTDPGPSAAFQDALVTGAAFAAGGRFVPSVEVVSGDVAPGDPDGIPATPGAFVPGQDAWLPGEVLVPPVGDWSPDGRLLFARGTTRIRIDDRGDTALALSPGVGPGIAVAATGGATDAVLALCGDAYFAFLGAGDEAEFTCGSLITTTQTGEVIVSLPGGITVAVPAGATATFIERDGGHEITARGGSLLVTTPTGSFGVADGETVFVAPPDAEIRGCGIGFWKSRMDVGRFPGGWPATGYGPGHAFESAFAVDLEGSGLTLGSALGARGGGLNALLRQATAALLNAAHPEVAYGLDPEAVRAAFRNALSSGDYETAKDELESLNQRGCPIDGK